MDLIRVVQRLSICDNEYHYPIYVNGLFVISVLSLDAVKLYFKEKYNFDFLEEMLGEQIYVN